MPSEVLSKVSGQRQAVEYFPTDVSGGVEDLFDSSGVGQPEEAPHC